MALTKCTECEREVSDKAESCPGCGAPIVASRKAPLVRTTAASGPIKLLAFLAIVAGILIGIAGGNAVLAGVLFAGGLVAFILARFSDG